MHGEELIGAQAVADRHLIVQGVGELRNLRARFGNTNWLIEEVLFEDRDWLRGWNGRKLLPRIRTARSLGLSVNPGSVLT